MAGIIPYPPDVRSVTVTLADPHHQRMLANRIQAAIRELVIPTTVVVRTGDAPKGYEVETHGFGPIDVIHARIWTVVGAVIRAYEHAREREAAR